MVGQDINYAWFVVNGPKHSKHQCGQKNNQQPHPTGSVSVCLTVRMVKKGLKIDTARPRSNIRNIWVSYGDSTHESGIKSASSRHLRTVLLWSGASCCLPVINRQPLDENNTHGTTGGVHHLKRPVVLSFNIPNSQQPNKRKRERKRNEENINMLRNGSQKGQIVFSHSWNQQNRSSPFPFLY